LLADAEQAALRTLLARQLSHFGPPTAPSSTASAACASFWVASGIGVAGRVDRAAAQQALFHLELEVERLQHAHGFAMISGPMPSPGSTQIFMQDTKYPLGG
jgi:hypothetical protein